MKTVDLRKATVKDKAFAVELDYRLDNVEHDELRREEKISKAISDEQCFVILADAQAVGFVLYDYRFFDQGWIELMVIDEKHRGKGIGVRTLDLICKQCKAEKVWFSYQFTSRSIRNKSISDIANMS